MDVIKNWTTKRIKRIPLFILVFLICGVVSADDKSTILAIREEGKEFEYVIGIIRHELASDFAVEEMTIRKETDAASIDKAMQSLSPKLVILVDNKAISLYSIYQNTFNDTGFTIPSLSLMGVLVEEAIQGIKNSTGISYEIPALTGILGLQSVVRTKLGITGVIHREFLNDFILRNKKICHNKGLDLQNVIVPNKSSNFPLIIRNALTDLIEIKGVQCIWIPNDNVLLQPELIQDVWIPVLSRYKVPVIVGVESLVQMENSFGSFAVLPDHASLGNQAASMIYEIQKNNWLVKNEGTEPPLSVFKIINYKNVKRDFGIREEALRSIDRVLR